MKFYRVLSIFVLLFVTLQCSDAVQCPQGPTTLSKVSCSEACAVYACPQTSNKPRYGCPEEAFQQCSDEKKVFDLVKSKGVNNVAYSDGSFAYVSGCGNEDDGTVCITTKMFRFNDQTKAAEKNGWKKGDGPVWGDASTNSGPKTVPQGSGSSNSVSAIQTGASKMIGILAIGLILSSALI